MFRNSTAKCKGIGILQSFVFAEGVVINTPGKESLNATIKDNSSARFFRNVRLKNSEIRRHHWEIVKRKGYSI